MAAPIALTAGAGAAAGAGGAAGAAGAAGAGMSAGTGMAVGQGIAAGGNLLAGILDQAIFQPQRNRAIGRQAAQMDPFIDALMSLGRDIGSGGDYGGLRGAAQNELTAGLNDLRAGMASRGVYSSGAALGAERALTSDVMSQLAAAINADQLARSQYEAALTGQAMQAIGSTPGYQYFDRDTGEMRGK